MKKYLLFVLFLGAVISYEASAQDNGAKLEKVKLGKTSLSVHPDAVYMLKLRDKTMEMSESVLDEIDQSSIVAAELVTKEKALEDYGDKGEFGVVLITFHKKYETEVVRIIQDAKRRRL